MATTGVCFTGMETDEREALHALFQTANSALGGHFALADESHAEILVVDLDSIYGQMTWLRARHGGRHIVALSAGNRADAGHSLARPVTVAALTEVLRIFAADANTAPARVEAVAAARSEPAIPPTDTAPVPTPSASAAEMPPPTPAPAPEPERMPRLGDHLEPGALAGPVRIARVGAEPLVLDPTTRVYFGPTALKALLPYCHGEMRADELIPLDSAQFAQVAKAGGAQPMARLRWLFALVGGEGRLLPGYGLDERYSLSKWPQIEREFPKHFRIATTMMKGPATIADIAAQSTSPVNEVIDFVNASLVSGFAQVDRPPPADAETSTRGGLFDRLRGKKP